MPGTLVSRPFVGGGICCNNSFGALGVGSPHGLAVGTAKEAEAAMLDNCDTSLDFEVSLGGVNKTVHLPKDVQTGKVSSIPCNTINPEFSGLLLVMCGANKKLIPDVHSCVHTASNNTACKKQYDNLEVAYVKAYVELTRLVSYYELLINSTTCKDTAEEKYNEEGRPFYKEIDELTKTLTVYTEKLPKLKHRIQVVM